MKWNDIRVSTKLWGAILGLLALMLGVQGFTQYQSSNTMDRILGQMQRYEHLLTLASRWQGLTVTNNERALAALMVDDEGDVKFLQERSAATSREIGEVQKELETTITSEESHRALALVAERRAAMMAVRTQGAEVRASGDHAAITSFVVQKLQPSSDRYIEALNDFAKLQDARRAAAMDEAKEVQRDATLLGLISGAIVCAIGIFLAAALVRSITRPLDKAVALAGTIAEGDLTHTNDDARNDEFGQLLQALSSMAARLRGVVTEVRRGVDSVSVASTEIANGNQDLSARTEQTAANLEETAASMEQLTVTVTQSADTARQANQLAANAAQAAERGGAVVGQVVHSMAQITDSSKKISDIIGVIDGIAFQTNILALNAAVEAARAGEQGRGFAVVAGEVRSLAQRSAEAAKEIKGLIGASVQSVQAGSEQVMQAGTAMGEIVGSVKRVSDLIGEISASAIEQRDGIGQVNQAVTNLDQMTQQNAALVEESAAAASALREQSQRLSEVVAVFNVGYSPDAAAVRTSAPAVRKPAGAGALPPAPPRIHVAKQPAPAPRSLSASSAVKPAPRAPASDNNDWESF